MNPLLKNCRTGFHDDILHRTYHYQKLLNSKTAIVNKHHHQYHSLLNKPYLKEVEKEQNQSNLKIIKSLFQIQRKNPRYFTQEDNQPFKRKFLMTKEYEYKNREKAVSSQNLRLYMKLVTAQSEFSSQKLKKFNQKINKYSRLIHHPLKSICQMDQQLYTTYRRKLHTNGSKLAPKNLSQSASIYLNPIKQKKKPFKLKRKKITQVTQAIEKQLLLDGPQH